MTNRLATRSRPIRFSTLDFNVGARMLAQLGLPLSVARTRAVRSLLYGVEPTNPLIIGFCAAILLAVVGVASYLPARRATAVDPAATFARG